MGWDLKWRVREVAIADCVHYCGFRYGRREFNPYENYVTGLAERLTTVDLRSRFLDFIRFYRPQSLGEALGVPTSRAIPLWWLPWKSWRKLFRQTGWCASPNEIPDILTYFCAQGVPWIRITEEFFWLESAWKAISTSGYRPQEHCYVTVMELADNSGSSFLVTDGNHRLSALAALGMKTVLVRQSRFSVAHRSRATLWPLVLSRHIGVADATALFDAYRLGNRSVFRALQPANILDNHGNEMSELELQTLIETSDPPKIP